MNYKNETPLVTVGIPTRNSNGTIYRALMSVVNQDYTNLEIIISDDGSTDSTEEICTQFSKQYSNVRYVRQKKDVGLTDNFDFVLKQGSGEFFMWLADDDALEPGIIKKYVEFLIHHPDYSLVSGQILYWEKDHSVFYEKDLNMEQNSPVLRVLSYYFKVVHGAIYYGLMRRALANKIPQRNRIGDDWHFVANLAYLGKIKNLDSVGYNKQLGGISVTFENYAHEIGASSFAAKFPRLQIAMDAFTEVLFHSPVYSNMKTHARLVLAGSSGASILTSYLVKEFPFIIGGKIKRFFTKPYELKLSKYLKSIS